DVVAADRGAVVVAEAAAGAAGDHHVAPVGLLQQAGRVQQCRLARARGRDQRHHLAAPQREVGAVEDHELALALVVAPLDRLEFQHRAVRHHSYRSASTGSSFAARQAGNSVAMNDSVSAISTTETVSPASILAGSWLRK